jgi:hypothetical protein
MKPAYFKTTAKCAFLVAALMSGKSALLTLKAAADGGAPLWTNRYNGPAGGWDQANAVVADNNGNVIVTGYVSATNGHSDCATVKYSSAGEPLWTNVFNDTGDHNDAGNAIAVNEVGDVFITGYSVLINGPYFTSHYVTLAYSSAGVPIWTNRYAYGNTINSAAAVAVDKSSGNVFVTGNSYGGQFAYGYATVAYSSAGAQLWIKRYSGGYVVDLNSYATALAVDTNGNLFVTGYSSGIGSSFDFATLMYSGSGASLWTNRYNGLGNGNDYARVVKTGIDGTVFVTGYSTGTNGDYDFATLAYSNTGTPLWTNYYDGPGASNDYAVAMTVGKSGRVFVTGYSLNEAGDYDYATVAYSNEGSPLWTNRYHGIGNDYAQAIAVDSDDNVFVTGYSTNSASNYDYSTVAYSNEGLPLWTNRYEGPGNLNDRSAAIAVGKSGDVFVTGYSFGFESGQDYATVKYSSSLPVIYLNQYVADNQLVLDWTNAVVELQSAATIGGEFTTVLGATSPYTNSLSGAEQYFRLKKN